MFDCKLCTKKFSSKQMMIYHIKNEVCVNDNNVICYICNKWFKNMKTLKTHNEKFNTLCSSRLRKKSHKATSIVNLHNNEIINSICDKDKKINELKDELKQCKEENKVLSLNCNVVNNNINNTNNITNIQINGIGKEDISYITKEIMIDICNSGSNSMSKCFSEVHLNPKYPENNNVRLSTKIDSETEIFDNDTKEWISKSFLTFSQICKKIVLEKIVKFHKDCKKDVKSDNYKKLINFIDSIINDDLEKVRKVEDDFINMIKTHGINLEDTSNESGNETDNSEISIRKYEHMHAFDRLSRSNILGNFDDIKKIEEECLKYINI
jgi:hypothetical protein